MELKCLQCLAEKNQAIRNGAAEVPSPKLIGNGGRLAPPIRDAVTLAPTWISQVVGGQLVMAAVAVPVCEKHLEVKEQSPAERALGSGLLLPGGMS